MSDKIIEIVKFKATSSATHNDVLRSIKNTDVLLSELDGFLHRDIAKNDEYWLEVVHWRNIESAKSGLEKFKKDLRSAELFSLIRPETVEISYFNHT